MALVKATVSEPLTEPKAVTQLADAEAQIPFTDEVEAAPATSTAVSGVVLSAQEEEASRAMTQTSSFDSDDDGFDDLIADLNFTSFPIIVLNNGMFQSRHPDFVNKRTTEFTLRPFKVVKQTLFKSKKGEGAAVAYSYDKVLASNGQRIADIQAEWAAAGNDPKGFVQAEYRLIYGTLDNPTEDMVCLSVPPTSKGRLGAIVFELKQRGQALKGKLLKCSLGMPIDGDGGKSFTPWEFKVVNEPA